MAAVGANGNTGHQIIKVIWTENTSGSSKTWSGITSSADGTKLAATVANGKVWISNDSGATWTENSAENINLTSDLTSGQVGKNIKSTLFITQH